MGQAKALEPETQQLILTQAGAVLPNVRAGEKGHLSSCYLENIWAASQLMMKCRLHQGKPAALTVQRIHFLLTKLEQLVAEQVTQTQQEELASVTVMH